MVDVDTFLTALYVVIDDFAKSEGPLVPGHPGRAGSLSESEVLTLAVFRQWGRFQSERAFYRYAERDLRAAFPGLPARSQLNRAIRRAQGALSRLGPYLARLLDADQAPYEVVDSTGLPVRNGQRRGTSWLDGQANLGHCTRLGWFFGVRALTCVTPRGVLTGTGLAPASTSDHPLAATFLLARRVAPARLPGVGRPAGGAYVADSGFDRPATPQFWAEQCGATVVSMPYRHTRRWPKRLRRWLAGLRQVVETVHYRLLVAFGLEHERPHALDGLQARWAAAVALHNFCCWLNRRLGRPWLAVADLVDW